MEIIWQLISQKIKIFLPWPLVELQQEFVDFMDI